MLSVKEEQWVLSCTILDIKQACVTAKMIIKTIGSVLTCHSCNFVFIFNDPSG